jgi:hypothetical protein
VRIHRRSELTPGAPAPGNAFDVGVAQALTVDPGDGLARIELDLLVRIPDDQVLLLVPRAELAAAGLTAAVAFSVLSARDPIAPPRLSVARPAAPVRLEPGVPYARILVLAAPLERFYFDPTLPDELVEEPSGVSTAEPILPDELRA